MTCLHDESIGRIADGCASEEELAHEAGCSACRRRVERVRALGAALRRLPLARERAPASLEATLRGLGAGARAGRIERKRWWRAMAGLAAAMAASLALLLAPDGGGLSEALADEAVSRHLRAFASGNGSGCQVESGDPEELARFLAAGLGTEVPVPAPPPGAELVGARTCSLFGERAGAVVYRSGGAAVTLFVPAPGTQAERACAEAVGECRSARDGQTVCVVQAATGPVLLVGELPAEQLCSVAAGS